MLLDPMTTYLHLNDTLTTLHSLLMDHFQRVHAGLRGWWDPACAILMSRITVITTCLVTTNDVDLHVGIARAVD